MFQINVLKYYAEQGLKHPVPKSQEGIEDDVLQMGGDFTIKTSLSNPILSFSYPSKSASDRPLIEQIIEKSARLD